MEQAARPLATLRSAAPLLYCSFTALLYCCFTAGTTLSSPSLSSAAPLAASAT